MSTLGERLSRKDLKREGRKTETGRNMMLLYLLLTTILLQSCTARVVDCLKGENACAGSRTRVLIGGVRMCCQRAKYFSIVNNECKCVEGLFRVGGSSFLSSLLGPRPRTGTRLISRMFSSSFPGRSHSSVHVSSYPNGFGSDTTTDWWKRASTSWNNFTRDMVAWTEGLGQLWANMTLPSFRLATLDPDLSQGSAGQRVKVKAVVSGTGTTRSPPLRVTQPPSPLPPPPPPPPSSAPTVRTPVGRRPIEP